MEGSRLWWSQLSAQNSPSRMTPAQPPCSIGRQCCGCMRCSCTPQCRLCRCTGARQSRCWRRCSDNPPRRKATASMTRVRRRGMRCFCCCTHWSRLSKRPSWPPRRRLKFAVHSCRWAFRRFWPATGWWGRGACVCAGPRGSRCSMCPPSCPPCVTGTMWRRRRPMRDPQPCCRTHAGRPSPLRSASTLSQWRGQRRRRWCAPGRLSRRSPSHRDLHS
mmetsp:Transcript_19014/g.57451  ORF Transcript_19014/g.57451 Transcript_19014/m.57451 type:complete len:218 (+) Transcript_19014:2568-3221(+)